MKHLRLFENFKPVKLFSYKEEELKPRAGTDRSVKMTFILNDKEAKSSIDIDPYRFKKELTELLEADESSMGTTYSDYVHSMFVKSDFSDGDILKLKKYLLAFGKIHKWHRTDIHLHKYTSDRPDEMFIGLYRRNDLS